MPLVGWKSLKRKHLGDLTWFLLKNRYQGYRTKHLGRYWEWRFSLNGLSSILAKIGLLKTCSGIGPAQKRWPRAVWLKFGLGTGVGKHCIKLCKNLPLSQDNFDDFSFSHSLPCTQYRVCGIWSLWRKAGWGGIFNWCRVQEMRW